MTSLYPHRPTRADRLAPVYILLVLALMFSIAGRIKRAHAPVPVPTPVADTFMGIPTKNCWEYSSHGSTPDHNQWATCMGVEYNIGAIQQ